jgi:hypothetical protein
MPGRLYGVPGLAGWRRQCDNGCLRSRADGHFSFRREVFRGSDKSLRQIRCQYAVLKIPSQRIRVVRVCRQIHLARFTVVAAPVTTFADFCAIFLVSRLLLGFHDARL